MRILFLAPHPFFQARGTPIAVRTVLEYLGSRGHQVDVLTYHEGEDVVIPNCRIHRIAAPPGVHRLRPGFSTKKLICDAYMMVKMAAMVRRTRYDLIHAVEESSFMAAALGLVSRTPYIYDMDSSLAEQLVDTFPRLAWMSGLLSRCEALAIRRSMGVLVVCRALEKLVQAESPGKPVGRVEDTTLLAPAVAEGNGRLLPADIAARGPVVMYVGNLEHYQGIDLLLEGFAVTARSEPSAQLVVVGGRPDDVEHYRSRAETLGISSRTHFLGPRPVEQLGALLAEAAVVVSPRLKGTNTPMKIFSYLDSGTAVLATRLPTHTQVVDDQAALLVEPTPEALGTGLRRLLAEPELRTALARKAKALVEREYTPAAARRKLQAFYGIIEESAARGAR